MLGADVVVLELSGLLLCKNHDVPGTLCESLEHESQHPSDREGQPSSRQSTADGASMDCGSGLSRLSMRVRWAGDRVVAAGTVLSEACSREAVVLVVRGCTQSASEIACHVASVSLACSWRVRMRRTAVASPVRVPVRVIVPAGPDVHVDPEVGRECLVGDWNGSWSPPSSHRCARPSTCGSAAVIASRLLSAKSVSSSKPRRLRCLRHGPERSGVADRAEPSRVKPRDVIRGTHPIEIPPIASRAGSACSRLREIR